MRHARRRLAWGATPRPCRRQEGGLSCAVTHPALKRGVGGTLPPFGGPGGRAPLEGMEGGTAPSRGVRGQPPPQRVSRTNNSSPPPGAQTCVPSLYFHRAKVPGTPASRRARQVAHGTGATFSRRPKARIVLCGHAPGHGPGTGHFSHYTTAGLGGKGLIPAATPAGIPTAPPP